MTRIHLLLQDFYEDFKFRIYRATLCCFGNNLALFKLFTFLKCKKTL